MAKRAAAKPATKSAATAVKKSSPAKRSVAAAKSAPVVKSTPAAKRPEVSVKAPEAPLAIVKATKVTFSSQAAAEDYKAMSKAAFDAYVKSGNLFAETFGAINREIMTFAQAAMESNLAAVRAMTEAKSLEEVVDLQTKHSRKSVDSFLAESAKLTGMSVEMTNGSIEPLKSNLKVTVEKFWKPLAA